VPLIQYEAPMLNGYSGGEPSRAGSPAPLCPNVGVVRRRPERGSARSCRLGFPTTLRRAFSDSALSLRDVALGLVTRCRVSKSASFRSDANGADTRDADSARCGG